MSHTREELENMPIGLLRNIDIQSKEEEELVQSVWNERQLEMPELINIDMSSKTDDMTPEKEMELQKEIDVKKAEAMAKLVPKTSTEGFVSLEKAETTTIESLPSQTEPEEIEETEIPSEPEIVSEPTVEPEKKARFCEFCDSKGVRHKKDCTRLSANNNLNV